MNKIALGKAFAYTIQSKCNTTWLSIIDNHTDSQCMRKHRTRYLRLQIVHLYSFVEFYTCTVDSIHIAFPPLYISIHTLATHSDQSHASTFIHWFGSPAPGLESLRRSQRPVSMVVHQKHSKWDSDPDFIGQFFCAFLFGKSNHKNQSCPEKFSYFRVKKIPVLVRLSYGFMSNEAVMGQHLGCVAPYTRLRNAPQCVAATPGRLNDFLRDTMWDQMARWWWWWWWNSCKFDILI